MARMYRTTSLTSIVPMACLFLRAMQEDADLAGRQEGAGLEERVAAAIAGRVDDAGGAEGVPVDLVAAADHKAAAEIARLMDISAKDEMRGSAIAGPFVF